MCIGSNWVNEAQDLIYVTKFCDLPNKQNPTQEPSFEALAILGNVFSGSGT